jgi:predicted esterase YcpF (UPF0227 family)
MITHLLYLHGFRSSPKSFKASLLAKLMQDNAPHIKWQCPQLPASPKEATHLIRTLVQDWPMHTSAVIGSSLGGFYAAWTARLMNFKSILINPATDPASDLQKHIGLTSHWHNPDESFEFKQEYVNEFMTLYPPNNSRLASTHADTAHLPSQLLMACTGDEVLDYKKMLASHPKALHYVIEGSDHAVSDFEKHVPVLLDFLGISAYFQ